LVAISRDGFDLLSADSDPGFAGFAGFERVVCALMHALSAPYNSSKQIHEMVDCKPLRRRARV
jgi:hypothetical protein